MTSRRSSTSAKFTGDIFYADMDEAAAKRTRSSMVRCARLSDRFDSPRPVRRTSPGPVLANYGVEQPDAS